MEKIVNDIEIDKVNVTTQLLVIKYCKFTLRLLRNLRERGPLAGPKRHFLRINFVTNQLYKKNIFFLFLVLWHCTIEMIEKKEKKRIAHAGTVSPEITK